MLQVILSQGCILHYIVTGVLVNNNPFEFCSLGDGQPTGWGDFDTPLPGTASRVEY
jgi:hypothetical protein